MVDLEAQELLRSEMPAQGKAAEVGEGCVHSCRVEMCLQERFMVLGRAENPEEQRDLE